MISTRRPLLLGHRGARRSAPENTVAGFDLALAHGCDGFEFDVRLTRDQKAIICHDPKLGGSAVASADYLQISSTLNDGKCLLLDDIIARYHQRAFLNIELKVMGLAALTVHALRQFNVGKKHLVVSSFLPEALQEMRRIDATIPLGWICDRSESLERWPELACEYVIPHFTLANDELVEDVHAAGKKLLVWSVNRAREMRRFAEMGIDGVISDDTQLLCRTLGAEINNSLM